jgi:PKD repeat protein
MQFHQQRRRQGGEMKRLTRSVAIRGLLMIILVCFLLIGESLPGISSGVSTDATVAETGAGWLQYSGSPYLNRKPLAVAATAPAVQTGTYTALGTQDTLITEAYPDMCYANYGYIAVGASLNTRSILEFDVSQFGMQSFGKTFKLRLYWYYHGAADPKGRTYWAYELDPDLDSSSWVESQATWHSYATGELWDTEGGDYATDDPIGASAVLPKAERAWVEWDITDIIDHAIDDERGIVKVIVKDETEGGYTPYGSRFYSSEYTGSPALTPRIEIAWSGTPSVPANYSVPIDIHRGSPTVEKGAWTVNSKTYSNRVRFTVTTYQAMVAGYQLKVIVDTASLVAGGFLGGSTSGYAKTVEFADSTGASPMYFWVQEAGATPENLNTSETVYWVRLPALSTNTVYACYMYVDPDLSAASSNYSAANVFAFFEHFDANAANLAAFLAAYDGTSNTEWMEDPVAGNPTVSVASSTLTVDSAATGYDGIASAFTIQDFRALFRITKRPGYICYAGMVDAGGVNGANRDGAAVTSYAGNEFIVWQNGALHAYDVNLFNAPFIIEFCKYGNIFRYIKIEDSPGAEPDIYDMASMPVTDVMHKAFVNSYASGSSVSIDWIAIAPEIELPPSVTFPNILYDKAGTVFLDNQCLHWPFDIAFTSSDGSTELYWWSDPLTELTKQPGDSMQVTVRMEETIDVNRSIYCYFGHNSITSTSAYCDPAKVFAEYGGSTVDWAWDAFETDGNWTEVAGDWSTVDVGDAVLRRGDVGNVGGQSGRLWCREAAVAKWGTDDYRMVMTGTLWEHSSGYWPTPFRVYTAQTDTLGAEFCPGKILFSDREYEVEGPGPFVSSFKVQGTKAYVNYYTPEGFGLAYCSLIDDPEDPANWTINTDGPFLSTAKIITLTHAAGIHTFDAATGVMSWSLYYNTADSTWYAFVHGFLGAGYAASCIFSTTDAPEDWNSGSWAYVAIGPQYRGTAFEDGDIAYDGSRYWYFYASLASGGIVYWRLDEDANAFPGEHAGDWVGPISPTIDKTPFSAHQSSPRLMLDGSDWWLFYADQGVDSGFSYSTRWVPNWIVAAKSATPNGPWVVQNTDKKYKQATATGVQKAYLTDSAIGDAEIVCEVQTGQSGKRQVGVLFRYNPKTDSGYFACLDYNNNDPKCILYRYVSGKATQLGTAYDIPQVPTPGFLPGYPWRIRVQCYGESIKIAYSAWGNPWIQTHALTNVYFLCGAVGVGTNTSEGYFNNIRISPFVLWEPVNRLPSQPTNVSPANGVSGVSLTPTLQSIGFSDPDVGDTHVASQWQMRTSASAYSSPVLDSGADSSNLTQITLSSGFLSGDTTYYWRVRHEDNHGAWSEWSVETSFATLNQTPHQPNNVSPANGVSGVSLTPPLQLSAFSDPDAGDSHAASQWQVTKTLGDYSSLVFDSGTDSSNLTSPTVPSGMLSYSTTYYWRGRHQDSHGIWSEWSTETSFITDEIVIFPDPNLEAAVREAIGNLTGDIRQSDLDSLTSLDASNSSITDLTGLEHCTSLTDLSLGDNQISDLSPLSGLISLTQLGLGHNQIGNIEPLVNNPGLGSGDWVDLRTNPLSSTSINTHVPQLEARALTVYWDTVNRWPSQPTNVSPANGAIGVRLTPTLQSSPFFDPDAGDTHAASQWQITATSGDYSSPVLDSGTNSPNLTSLTVPSGILNYSTTYYWHVGHQDSFGNWSEWSKETSFTTVAALQADFTADRTAVVVGQSIQFTNLSSGGVPSLNYEWDFNNDGIWDSTLPNPTYSYGGAGTYTVVLKVTDSATNADTETKINFVGVSVVPPLQVDFSADGTAVVVGQSIQFTNLSSGGVPSVSYQWDFNNDGIWNSTAQNPTYSYGSTGTYAVVLRVTDSVANADTETKTGYITVYPPGPPAAPTLVSPANGASVSGTTVPFEWGSVPGAVKYRLLVSTSTNILDTIKYKRNVDLVDLGSGLPASYNDSGYPANGTKYYWWVWAYAADGSYSLWSQVSANERNFTNVGSYIAAPTLASPANGASVSGTSVTFEWGSVSGAVKYKLLVSTSTDILDTTKYKCNVDVVGEATTTYVDTGYPANGTKYYWWVWAYAADGSYSLWSQVSANERNFTNVGSYIAAPTLASPANGASVSGTSVTFEWGSVSGAVKYKLLVSTSTDILDTTKYKCNVDVIGEATTTYVDTGYPANGTKYYWWVWAYNADGTSSLWAQVSANGRWFTNTV